MATGEFSRYLKEGERIDDLERNNLRIIQNPDRFCFGMDAVLLTGFVRGLDGRTVVDLCSGNGIIPILLSAKTKAKSLTGLEILEENVDMAMRSISLNGIGDRVSVIRGDVVKASETFGRSCIDAITCNPPYMAAGRGITCPTDARNIARHEILCTLDDVIRESSLMLKHGGRLFMVHRPSRLAEIIVTMNQYDIEPKRIKFVHPYVDKKPNMVLIEGVKYGGRELVVEEPVIVFEKEGVYTRMITEVYGY